MKGRARDSNPQGPRGPVDFKSTALPVEASPPGPMTTDTYDTPARGSGACAAASPKFAEVCVAGELATRRSRAPPRAATRAARGVRRSLSLRLRQLLSHTRLNLRQSVGAARRLGGTPPPPAVGIDTVDLPIRDPPGSLAGPVSGPCPILFRGVLDRGTTQEKPGTKNQRSGCPSSRHRPPDRIGARPHPDQSRSASRLIPAPQVHLIHTWSPLFRSPQCSCSW